MKVLFVDDDEDIRAVAELSLQAVGKHETVLACDATEALELARGFQPDVVMMDMMMPGMDGLTALSVFAADDQLKHIPVIFITAKVQPSEIQEYMDAGATGVIQKPFDPMSLSAQVSEILEKPAA